MPRRRRWPPTGRSSRRSARWPSRNATAERSAGRAELDARPDEADALARLYDLDLSADPGDLDLYLALARRTSGPILELAAGTGRLAVPLAAAGYDVTGVDVEPAMLRRARAAARAAGQDVERRLTWVEADLVGLRLPAAGTFRLAFIALNSLLLVPSREAQREAVQTLAAHLAPGGLAVVDAWQPDAEDLARFDGRLILEWARVDPDTGRRVAKTGSAQHHGATRSVTLSTLYEEWRPGEPATRWWRVDAMRLIAADELVALADEAGLDVEVVAGGYDLEPLGPDGDRAVVVAVRR